MGGEIVFILIVLVVGVVAAVVMLIAGIFKLVLSVTGTALRAAADPFICPDRKRPVVGPGHCTRDGCGVVNPPHARFCRRCGKAIAGQTAASPMRRAAMW